MSFNVHPPVEARAWLTNNPNESVARATNRFGTTARALEFVEALYRTGATEVLVDDPDIDSSGEPYADTLLVRFCGSGDERWNLEAFGEREGPGDVPRGDFVMRVREHEIIAVLGLTTDLCPQRAEPIVRSGNTVRTGFARKPK